MSQRHTKTSSHKKAVLRHRQKQHKVLNSLPLHKYKISRIAYSSSAWPLNTQEDLLCAYDPTSLPKAIRAYLAVHVVNRGPSASYTSITENTPVKQKLRIETEAVDSESYCNCNQPYSPGELMFKCEGFCGNWYHPECLKMKVEEIEKQKNSIVRWYCPKCVNKAMEVMNECYEVLPTKSRATTIG